MNKKVSVLALALSGVIIAGSLSGCYFFPEEEKLLEPPVLKVEDVTYSTYKAVKKTIINKAAASGYIVSNVQQDCMFTQYDDAVKTVFVKSGDVVKKGDLIAEYDVWNLEFDLRRQELVVQQAENTYNATGSENDRLQLEIEKNTLAQYQSKLDGARIYAPCDGTVSYAARLKPGETVKAYTVIATIIDPGSLYIKATVNDDRKFTKGQEVVITVEEEDFAGTVVKTPVEAKEEGDDDTTSIYVEFKGTPPSFTKVGKVADVAFIKEKADDAIVIPKHLVKSLNGKNFVQIFKDGVKTEVEVEVGITNATEAQILSGVSEGDEIVVK